MAVPDPETYSFGAWLKQRREHLRLTQRELAAGAYCSVAMIKKIEADERRPSLEMAASLAVALQIPDGDRDRLLSVARGERPVDGLWHIRGENTHTFAPFRTPRMLPKVAAPFVGRADELAQLGQRLADPSCRLLTLSGAGGVGKTRLALAAGHAHGTAFPDGAVFVPLAAVTDAESIPTALAGALRLTLTADAAEQTFAYLHRRTMLLILDNCEQIDGDLAWLSELLGHAPGVKLLATSRERLHLSEEWVYIVSGLAESAALFVETARRLKQDFDVEAERPAVLRICRLVDDLPLAVELAAGWTPLMSCTRIAAHIERDLSILTGQVRNAPDRHQSIQAVFDHSWTLLSPAEQHALMRLSVFRGGWDAEQSLAVADADLPMLRRLVDKSLVRVGVDARYELHELIRQYAAQKLAQSGLEHETRDRHFDAFLDVATRFDSEQFGPNSMAVVARFDREQDNIRAALGWSLDNERTEAALDLIARVSFYWSRRGFYREGAEWTRRAIQQAGDLESAQLSMALSIGAAFYFIQGRYAETEPLAFRAMSMARRLEDPGAVIMALGLATFISINIDQALAQLHEGIDLIQETGKMPEMLPLYYQGAATWFHSGGRIAEAAEYYQKSIDLFRQSGAYDFIADPLGQMSQLALQEGRLQDAYDLIVESIDAAQKSGYYNTFSAWGISRLGQIQLYMGEDERAQRSLEQALQLFDDGLDTRIKLDALLILSEIALARGDVEAAVDKLGAGLEICDTLYRQLQATQKLEATPDALPIDLVVLCSRASLVAAAQGDDERAVTLIGIADSLRVQSRQVLVPPLRAKLEATTAVLRARLPEDRFAAALEAGRRQTLAGVFEFVFM